MPGLVPLSGAPLSAFGSATSTPPTPHSPLGPYPLRQGAAHWAHYGFEPPSDPIVGANAHRRRVSPLLPQTTVRASQILLQVLVRANSVPPRVSQTLLQALVRAGSVPPRVSQTLLQALARRTVAPKGVYPLRQGAAHWLQHGPEAPPDLVSWLLQDLLRAHIAPSRAPIPPRFRLWGAPWWQHAAEAPPDPIVEIVSHRRHTWPPPPRNPGGPYPLPQGAAIWAHDGCEPPPDPIIDVNAHWRRVSPLLPQATIVASQFVLQVLVRGDIAPVWVSQTLLSALIRANGVPPRVSQALLSALVRGNGVPPRVAQSLLSILVWSRIVSTTTTGSLAVFPSLPGLAFDVVKRPTFYTASAKSASGYQVRVGYATAPTWEWDLTYEFLKDATAASDLKQLLGFWLAMQGDLRPFLFQDPDDYAVTRQAVGTGDGSTTTFTLYRTYGSGQTGTEPIGYVNGAEPFNVYLNGTLVASSTYTIVSTTPMAQQIKFTSAPASGAVITADFAFYYFVHFKENTNEWTKFMDRLWDMKKLTLESLRG